MGAPSQDLLATGIARTHRARLRRYGTENRQAAPQLRITDQTVCKWRKRFRQGRLEGPADEPRPGAPRQITDAQVEALITRTLESGPPQGTHCSTRITAEAIGMSQSASVLRRVKSALCEQCPIEKTTGMS